ncbi:MAG: Mur ligase family protein [Patescibacteria group bacterium]|nr:Mur ligase family protein [Patescibacteria group bacterium]
MKPILKFFLKHYLRFFARLSIAINKPIVIAVSGSINMLFAKEAIKKILTQNNYKIHTNVKNFNTAIGMPLTILNLPSAYSSYHNWIPIMLHAPKKIFLHRETEILILNYGTSNPGDIKDLLKIAKPNIAVICNLTKRHLEGFSDMGQLAGEYQCLINSLNNDGLVVLNNDNRRLHDLALKTKKTKITFSIKRKSDYQVTDIVKTKQGMSFSVIKNSKNISNIQTKRHGEHHIYAALIATIVNDHVKQKINKTKRKTTPD